MASKSLGPFPKSFRWHQILGPFGEDRDAADLLLEQIQSVYAAQTQDLQALRAISFLVALPVATRSANPVTAMSEKFEITVANLSAGMLLRALNLYAPAAGDPAAAAQETILALTSKAASSPTLFEVDPALMWRKFDGPGFCDLAFEYFSALNRITFSRTLAAAGVAVDSKHLQTFAREMAIITRSFSARWFNACALNQVPEPSSIHWYLGHCLGKLDLELSREKSNWVEPKGNPWRRRKRLSAEQGLYDRAK